MMSRWCCLVVVAAIALAAVSAEDVSVQMLSEVEAKPAGGALNKGLAALEKKAAAKKKAQIVAAKKKQKANIRKIAKQAKKASTKAKKDAKKKLKANIRKIAKQAKK